MHATDRKQIGLILYSYILTDNCEPNEVRYVRRGADLALVQPRVAQLDRVDAQAPVLLAADAPPPPAAPHAPHDHLVEDLEAVARGVDKVVDREEHVVVVAHPGDLRERELYICIF